MNLSGFTFILTEECNFNCSYCYQKIGKTAMDIALLKKAFDYFSPFFNDDSHISFYGGEPLLAFEIIKKSVDYILEKKLKKKFNFALTTNGSLLNTEMFEFFNRHKFSLLLSFDGLAQEILRKKESFETVLTNVKKTLTYPGLEVSTNSVFTPESVHLLAESLEFIVNLGIKKVQVSISTISKWDRDSILQLEKELGKTKKFLIPIYKKTGAIPIDSFMKKTQKNLFGCNAGESRFTTAADGKLWGCYLFSDYFKGKEETKGYRKYCFGDLDTFIENQGEIYPRILANYEKLRMDYFSTPDRFCMECDDLLECYVCPVDAALSGAVLGNIPAHLCEINKVLRKARQQLWEELENKE